MAEELVAGSRFDYGDRRLPLRWSSLDLSTGKCCGLRALPRGLGSLAGTVIRRAFNSAAGFAAALADGGTGMIPPELPSGGDRKDFPVGIKRDQQVKALWAFAANRHIALPFVGDVAVCFVGDLSVLRCPTIGDLGEMLPDERFHAVVNILHVPRVKAPHRLLLLGVVAARAGSARAS